MLIREARAADAAALLALERQVLEETQFMMREPGEIAGDVATKARELAHLAECETQLRLLAWNGDHLLGYCGVRGYTLKRLRHSATLWMAVAADSWGRGLGSSLMQAAIDWAEVRGVQRIELGVDAGNQRALCLYCRFGFEIEGRRRAAIRLADGSWRDDYIMARLSPTLIQALAEK